MTTTTSPKKTITTLPDLCLLTIFDTVSLNDIMVNVSLTCRRWNSLRHSILSRRTKLHLKLGKPEKEKKYALDDLTTPRPVLTVEQAFLLSSLFGNTIRNLRLTVPGNRTVEYELTVASVAMLLHLWAENVSSLSIDWCPREPKSLYGDQLGWAINSMNTGSLRVLSINLRLIQGSLRRPFPVMAQLHRLQLNYSQLSHYDDYNYVDWLCEWVGANYAHNRRLEIRLPMCFYSNIYASQLERIYASGAPLDQFTECFPSLAEPGTEEERWNYGRSLHHLLGRLRRLTRFCIDNRVLSLAEITRCLSQLTHLNTLHLELRHSLVMVHDGVDGENNSNNSSNNDDDDDHDQSPLRHHYRPLPSVRTLILLCREELHLEPEQVDRWVSGSSMPHDLVFPGLEGLRIEFDVFYRATAAASEAQQHSRVVSVAKQYARPYAVGCPDLSEIVIADDFGFRFSSAPIYTYTPQQLLTDSPPSKVVTYGDWKKQN